MNLRTIPHDQITRPQAVQARLSGALWAARTLTLGYQEYAALGVSADPRLAWTDVSYWQGNVNMGVLAVAGFHGVFIRAGIFWGYKDPRALTNIQKAKDAGLYWSTYHVLYPDQSVQGQFDNWIEVQNELDQARPVPRVIDLELHRNQSAAVIAQRTQEMSDLVLAHDGHRPIIYSRYSLVNSWLASWSPALLNEHYYWLAQYLWDRTKEHPGPMTQPDRVHEDRMILHQTADKKPGPNGSVESKGFDWDRWSLDGQNAAEMSQWISDTWGPQAPPLTLEQRVARLEGFHGL